MSAAALYSVTAVMQGQRAKLVVSGGADPYVTTDRAVAERTLAHVSGLSRAYIAPRIEIVGVAPELSAALSDPIENHPDTITPGEWGQIRASEPSAAERIGANEIAKLREIAVRARDLVPNEWWGDVADACLPDRAPFIATFDPIRVLALLDALSASTASPAIGPAQAPDTQSKATGDA